jgi:hypothetical protein
MLSKFYFFRAAKGQHSVHGGADGAAGPKHVIHHDHFFAFNNKIYFGLIRQQRRFPSAKIIAVKGDIQVALFYSAFR